MNTHKIGETRIVCGETITLVEYNSYKDCKVLLSDGVIQHCDYRSFQNRKIPYSISTHAKLLGKEKSIDRTNETRHIDGKEIKIIRWSNNHNLDILLSDGNIIENTKYEVFCNLKSATLNDRKEKRSLVNTKRLKGKMSNNNKPKYGEAILDNICVDNDGNLKQSYKIWCNVLKRSYDEKYKIEHPTYLDVCCCEEWKLYSNFEIWYNNNYYELGDEQMSIDKDILFKGNKIYSAETCIFAPQRINALFTKNNANRNYLLGVYKVEKYNKFSSKVSKGECSEFLGYFNTEEEAFNSYKMSKENYIKEVADEYKSKYPNFPQKLYDALYSYQVERTD